MLGNQDTSVQIRGIYEMLRVVEEQPDMFHVGMMRHLCALLREQNSNGLEPRDDRLFDSPSSTVVAASLEIITSRSKKRVLYEQAADYVPDLRNVSLLSLELKNANFTNCILRQALFCGSQLAGADFTGSDVSDAAFSKRGEMPAMGLTGCQLALAYADPDLPPLLDGVKDEKTGENLVWKK